MRISFVTLAVTDLDVSRTFYSSAFGLAPVRSGRDHVFFNLDGTVLALFCADAMARETGAATAGPGSVAFSWNVEQEADVEATVRRVVDAGGCMLRAPHHKPWGALATWIADPDGHPWEVVCNPALPRRPDGGVDLR
jgi:catechol 2,3-dioxygenase-like lactoylglutathione lyase family enzyme